MTIKRWFLNQNFTSNERLVIESADMAGELEIVKETEKAIQFKASSDYGTLKFWCPKSCLAENETEREKQAADRFHSGLNYNEVLVKFAKDNGVKGVRIGMKTASLIKKIREAGLEVPARN